MKKSLKQYSPLSQIGIVISFYIGFMVLEMILFSVVTPLLCGHNITELRRMDTSLPGVLSVWRFLSFADPIIMYLMPAIIFVMLISPRPIEWLHVDKPVQWRLAILVILIVLVAIPADYFVGYWNTAWQSDASRLAEEKNKAISIALMKMPDFASLLINLVLYAIVPTIARVFFFHGVLQKLLIQRMQRAPWIAIIIISVIFGISTFEWSDFIARILLGFLFGTIYYLSSNLWLSVLGYFIANAIPIIVSYLNQLGVIHQDLAEYPNITWYYAVISLAITVGLLWYLSKKSVSQMIPEDQLDIESIGG